MYDLTHVKKILHQQLVMVFFGGKERNNFLLLLLRKQKHWHSQKSLLLRSCMLNFNQRDFFSFFFFYFIFLFLAMLHPPLSFRLTNNLRDYSVWLCLHEGFCHHTKRNTSFSFIVATIFIFLFKGEEEEFLCMSDIA